MFLEVKNLRWTLLLLQRMNWWNAFQNSGYGSTAKLGVVLSDNMSDFDGDTMSPVFYIACFWSLSWEWDKEMLK